LNSKKLFIGCSPHTRISPYSKEVLNCSKKSWNKGK